MLKKLFTAMIAAQEKKAREVVRYMQRRQAINELERMSDHELSDIGIHRTQIKEIVYNGT